MKELLSSQGFTDEKWRFEGVNWLPQSHVACLALNQPITCNATSHHIITLPQIASITNPNHSPPQESLWKKDVISLQ